MLTKKPDLKLDIVAIRKLVHAIKSMDRYMGRISTSKVMPENRRLAIADLKDQLAKSTPEQVERLSGEEKSIYEQARKLVYG